MDETSPNREDARPLSPSHMKSAEIEASVRLPLNEAELPPLPSPRRSRVSSPYEEIEKNLSPRLQSARRSIRAIARTELILRKSFEGIRQAFSPRKEVKNGDTPVSTPYHRRYDEEGNLIRRPVYNSIVGMRHHKEAMERINYAKEKNPPGTPMRWDKMVLTVNRTVEPKDPDDDPIRLKLTKEQLMALLVEIYENIEVIQSDGLALMREYLPKLYDKHTVERGKRVSQSDRNARGLVDACYAYGEVSVEVFATIQSKINLSFGWCTDTPAFYDLGSGVGQLVYAAALVGEYNKCVGIDFVESCLKRGSARMERWKNLSTKFTQKYKDVRIDFIYDNIFECTFQAEGTFLWLHWTAFSTSQRDSVSDSLKYCREGTYVVTLTHPLSGSDYHLHVKDTCEASWGTAIYHVYEKTSVAAKLPSQTKAPTAFNADGSPDMFAEFT